MLIQSCATENKQRMFAMLQTDIGTKLVIDTIDTYPEFISVFDNNTKQVVSDDETELLMIYRVEESSDPQEQFLALTYMIPFEMWFPSYQKPVVVMNYVVSQLFNEYPDQDNIVCLLPYMPFIGQVLLMSGFYIMDQPIENFTTRSGVSIDYYIFIKMRS